MNESNLGSYEIEYIRAGAIKRARVRALLDSIGATYLEERGALGSTFWNVHGKTDEVTYDVFVAALQRMEHSE